MKKMMMILALLFAMVGSSFGADTWLFRVTGTSTAASDFNVGVKIVTLQPMENTGNKGVSIFCDNGLVYTLSESSTITGLSQSQMMACFLAAQMNGRNVNFLGKQASYNSGVYECTSFIICE